MAGNIPFALASSNTIAEPVTALVSFASLALAAPLLSMAYIVIVADWASARPSGALSNAGAMSLTAYVLEGVLAGLIFNGYGLAQYGAHGAATVFAIACAVFLATELICTLWRRAFGQGPLERLLRTIAG